MHPPIERFPLVVGSFGAAAIAAYGCAVRPRFRRWGATDDETREPLPGDDLVPRLSSQMTLAVTIDAPAEAVWPWLVQMGQDRGGLSSYLWVENGLLRLGIRNAERIEPAWQDLNVGDRIWFAPEDCVMPRFGPVVAAIDPERSLILAMGEPGLPCPGTWQFVLRRRADGRTRLLLRARASADTPFLARRPNLLLEPGYFLMERRMLLGIKERAERPAMPPSAAEQDDARPSTASRRADANLTGAGAPAADPVPVG